MKRDLSNFQTGSRKPDEEIPNFCPKCRTEYREGFTICADCGVPLVHELPAQRPSPDKEQEDAEVAPETTGSGEWVTVLEGADSSELMVAISVLESDGIASLVQGDRLQELVEPGRIGTNFSVPVGAVKLQVQKEDLDDARQALSQEEEDFDSESRVEELDQELKWEVAWFAGFGLTGFALAYALVPGDWDDLIKVLIYVGGALFPGLLGSHIGKGLKRLHSNEQ